MFMYIYIYKFIYIDYIYIKGKSKNIALAREGGKQLKNRGIDPKIGSLWPLWT